MAEGCEVAAWLKLLPSAPEFRPTEAEFADPIAYILKIEAEARSYGICKIIPPYPRAPKSTVMANLNRSLLMQASDFSYVNATGDVLGCCQNKSRRTMGGCMPPLKAGCRNARHGNYCHPSPSPPTTLVSSHPRTRSTPLSSVFDTDGPKAKFNTRRQQLGHSTGKRSKASVQSLAQKLVWQSGESYTLEQFEAKAKQFARARLKTTKDLSPYVIESLFWKAATDRTITVEYGNDIPGSAFGDPSQFSLEASFNRGKRKRSSDVEDQGYSFHQHAFKELRTRDSENEKDIDYISPQHGRPEIVSSRNISSGMKCSSFPIIEKLRPRRKAGISVDDAFTGSELTNSFWNMKVLPRAPGSLLRYMPDEVPGVTSPMVYIGMLFSWFAWHVEDHELHSLNYLHTGAPKTWYAVPGDAAPALEEVVRVYGYGNSIDTRAAFTLLGEKTTVMSPEVLLAAGVPCCRLVQNAGDFVVTFPRSYHQGFSHGFNCGEAANFASPAWLEVAKDAATRRAAMDCLPMLSHQQLLYLLALSFPLRAPLCLASESRSSRSKDAVSSSGEEAVKIIFTNDVAHNNRLLGLLADSGVSGFVFVRDGANFSAVSTEQSSVSKPVVGNNLKTIGLMHTILPEDASEAENKSKDERSIEYHSFSTLGSECYKKAQNADTNTITTMFRWGTFPCAACGLLCYPSIAVVQPLSCTKEDYASFQDIRNDENNNLSTLYLEEGPKSDPGHLAPFFTMNDENIRSDFVGGLIPGDILYCATVHCEPKEDALHFEIGRKERGDSEQQHGPEERPASASLEDHHMNKVSKDAVTKLTQVRGCSELKLFLETDQATRSASGNVSDACLLKDQILTNVSQDYDKSAERKNLDWHPSGSVFEGREKFFKPGNFFLMNNMKDTDCKASKDKEHDTLAVVYASNSRHPYLCESTGRSMDVNMQNGSISMCFHSDLSSMQSDKIGTLLDVKWHSVKEEGTYIPSLHSDTLLRSSELNHARAPEGDGKLICDESLLSAGDCSFMATEPESELDLYHPTDRLPGCNMGMSQNECRFSSLASKSSLSIEKDDRMLNLEDRQASPDIVKASDYFTGLEETSLVSVPLHSPNMGRCGEGSTDAPYPTLCSAFCADTSESRTNICHDSCCPLEVTIADKNLNLLESSKQPDFRRASCQADCYSDRINDNTCDLSPVSRTNLSDQFSGSGRQNQIRRVDIDSSAKQSSPLKSLKVLDCKTSGKHSDSVSINETINAFSDAKFGFDMNWVDIDGRCRSTLSLLEENSCHEIDKSVLMNKGGNSGKNAVNDVDISIRDHSFNKTPSNPSILPFSSNTFEPRFLCLEHALEAHHRLRKLECDSQMLIICHSDINKIESHAQSLCKDLNLNQTWRCISYNEATEEQKLLIHMAMKAEEQQEDDDQDWVVRLGMSLRHCEVKASSGFFSGTNFDCEVDAEALQRLDHSINEKGSILDYVAEERASSGLTSHRKVSVAGHWCGKIWMNYQVHPALGGSYNEQTQLQALQKTGRGNIEGGKILSLEEICTGTTGRIDKGGETTNFTSNRTDMGCLTESAIEAERIDRKRKAPELAPKLLLSKPNCQIDVLNCNKKRDLVEDSPRLDSSCLTSAFRRVSNSFEEFTGWNKQSSDKNVCSLQSSNENSSNSNGGNSHVSDVNGIDEDGADMDIWQDLDVGCYSQEVLSLDTIAEVADPFIVDTCRELDNERQEDLIPGMLEEFFCEGPSTRLRARSNTRIVNVDYEEVITAKHSEPLFSTGKRRKQTRQKSKKLALQDLDDECGAYVCELDGCSMSFSSKQELNLHKRNACTFAGCGKRFGSHKYLLQHRRVHLDDRPLKCPWKGCKMTFKWKWACTEHYRVHTGERPYVCPIPECGRTFRFVSDFSRHKRKTGHTK